MIFYSILFFEDLHHQLCLNLVQLLQRKFQSWSVLIRSFVEHALQAKGGAPHEQFGISQFLTVIGNTRMGDLLCIGLQPLEGLRSLLRIARIELPAGQVRHLTDELGVEKTLVSGLGLIRLGLKLRKSRWTIAYARGKGVGTSQRQSG